MTAIEITMIVFLVAVCITSVILIVLHLPIVYVRPVSAGIKGEEDLAKDIVIGKLSRHNLRRYKSQGINPAKYKFKEVQGNCMKPRGISLGDIVMVEEFGLLDRWRPERKVNNIKPGDILFIDFVDESSERRIKLREFISLTEDRQSAQTKCYDANGRSHKSSKPHRLKDIHGIVRFVDHMS